MLSEEDFKYKYLQQPITFLTEENLDKLETHCRKTVNFERGVEHKVVLELLDRYYQNQKEIQDKNNLITKLQKEIDRQKEKRENQKVELAILNEKQKEMNKLKNTVNSYYGMFKKQEKVIREIQKENEEKDKQIDLILKEQIEDGYLVNFNNLKEARKYYEELSREKGAEG